MTSVEVTINSLVKAYKLGRIEVQALRGLSLKVEAGRMVSIIGPSGSGKTTLLNILGGLDRATAGTVTVGNTTLTELAPSELVGYRRDVVGHIFQALNLIPTLTAQENVEVPLYVGKHKGSPSARAQELLALVGLSHRLNHRPNQLSGGEQQRVAIARALATDPAFVIADEPTGNLDARNGENVLELIAQLREQTGKTFIIATHDPVVASHADHAIRIVDGLIAEID